MAKKRKTVKRVRTTNVTKEKAVNSQRDKQKLSLPTERNMRCYRVRVECPKCYRQYFRTVEKYKSPRNGERIPGRCTNSDCGNVQNLTVVTVFGILV